MPLSGLCLCSTVDNGTVSYHAYLQDILTCVCTGSEICQSRTSVSTGSVTHQACVPMLVLVQLFNMHLLV